MRISPENLRSTSKAKLKYDRHWYRDGKLSAILEEITKSQHFVALHPFCLAEYSSCWNHLTPSSGQNIVMNFREKQDSIDADASCSRIRFHESNNVPPRIPFVAPEELPHIVKAENEIREYERQQRLKIQEKIDSKRKVFATTLDFLYEKSLLELRIKRERRRFFDGVRERELEAETEAGEDELKKQHQQLRHDHESFAKMSDERLKEASLLDKQEEEEAFRRVELRQKISTLAACKQHVSATYQQIVSVVRSCQNLHLVQDDVRSAVQSMNEVVADVQKILDRVRIGKVDDSDLDLMRHLDAKTNKCLEIIKLGVELANKAAEAEKNASSQNEASTTQSVPTASAVVTPDMQPTNCAHPLGRYVAAIGTLNNTVDSYKDLSTDLSLKSYRAAFKMAINAPVNSISAQSGSQVYDKLNRLSAILSGRQVDLTNGRRFSVNEHHRGEIFCMDLLAQKFVSQGEKQVSSSHVAAFPISAVIVGLWKEFPTFGELFLAHCYVKCPYLVPYHLPRSEGQSDIDYYSGLGYNVVDNVLEQQDKFLERMSGIVRLYAAVVQSQLPSGNELSHPHGIECGWRWLACILSTDPLPDITATVIFDFLEVCGHSLQLTYGKQFRKLLMTLCQDYLHRIQAVTVKGSGGPITRLETFLQECISRGSIKQPEGILPQNFWLT